MSKICGFAVVRLAKRNFRGVDYYSELEAPQVDGIYYHGVERLDWFDLDSETLPANYSVLYEQLDNTSIVSLTKNFEIAQKLLDFSNRTDRLNEIIAIYSKALKASYGSFTTALKIDWIGEDVANYIGSMLREGIFTKPHLFSEFKTHLNQYGLFEINSQITDLYVKYYKKLSTQGEILENFSDRRLDKIWIGKPKM
ncbi:MAG: hypothetical protein VSS75_025445 [Candidatus Parabeggiatoa sp.]|nr:hypothetical protein [Candidatus Parabeggiatoa sp.]